MAVNKAEIYSFYWSSRDALWGRADASPYEDYVLATVPGKSKGHHSRPEVSRILAKVIGIGAARSARHIIRDPTCGSGSLLLETHDGAPYDLTIYGRAKDPDPSCHRIHEVFQ